MRAEAGVTVRDVTVLARDADHIQEVAAAAEQLESVEVEHVSDRTFLLHLGGKIEVALKAPLATRDDLSMAYTPGVARVSQAIADDPEKAWSLTIKRNTVAIVSDGTAVLGLGDIGPEAAMPVMEGKAMLLKEFAGVDGWPVCLATTDTDEIVAAVTAIAPVYGAINLEDISAPRCFEIEERLRATLDIPVFHDDQHGTAIVVYAAFVNALRVVGKRPQDVKVVVTGVGAAGVAVTRILRHAGVGTIVGCDRQGAVYAAAPGLDGVKADYAERDQPRAGAAARRTRCSRARTCTSASRSPGRSPSTAIRSMAKDAIVFAMANPTPEVAPEELDGLAAVVATGRSDYPNQINNVLAFPGVFRGALDVRARDITEGMKLAAGDAIAAVIGPDELGPEYIIPSVFNREVVRVVAAAVAEAAERDGVARRRREATLRLAVQPVTRVAQLAGEERAAGDAPPHARVREARGEPHVRRLLEGEAGGEEPVLAEGRADERRRRSGCGRPRPFRTRPGRSGRDSRRGRRRRPGRSRSAPRSASTSSLGVGGPAGQDRVDHRPVRRLAGGLVRLVRRRRGGIGEIHGLRGEQLALLVLQALDRVGDVVVDDLLQRLGAALAAGAGQVGVQVTLELPRTMLGGFGLGVPTVVTTVVAPSAWSAATAVG